MTKEVQEYVVAKTHELMEARSCCADLKAAAQAWLAALGSEQEAEETARYIAELEEDIIPVDGLIAFAGSPEGKAHFGEELANHLYTHGLEIKAAGAVYCDCPACAVVAQILEKKAELL